MRSVGATFTSTRRELGNCETVKLWNCGITQCHWPIPLLHICKIAQSSILVFRTMTLRRNVRRSGQLFSSCKINRGTHHKDCYSFAKSKASQCSMANMRYKTTRSFFSYGTNSKPKEERDCSCLVKTSFRVRRRGEAAGSKRRLGIGQDAVLGPRPRRRFKSRNARLPRRRVRGSAGRRTIAVSSRSVGGSLRRGRGARTRRGRRTRWTPRARRAATPSAGARRRGRSASR